MEPENHGSSITPEGAIEDLFVFGIPLVPRSRAANWQRVLDNLQATLQSILQQKDQNFHCLIAVEDPIPLPEVKNPKVTLVTIEEVQRLNFGRDNYELANKDAALKRAILRTHANELGATYFMGTDADDLISNRVVAFTRSQKPEYGAAITRGYVMDSQTGKCLPVPGKHVRVTGFDTYCGTSIIMNLKFNAAKGSGSLAQLWDTGHNLVRAAAIENSTPLLELNVPLGIYMLNSGENISKLESNAPRLRLFEKHIVENINRYGSPLAKAQLMEFGLWSG